MTDTPSESAPAPSKKPAKKPMNRWFKAALILVALIALYALLGFVAAPRLARSMGEEKLAEALKREVGIHEVRFNPFTLVLEVEGVTVMEPDGQSEFASLKRLMVDVDPATFLRLAVGVDRILVEEPYLHVSQDADGSTNFSDLMASDGGDEEEGGDSEEAAAQGGSIFPVIVNDLSVRGGRLAFEDKGHGVTHTVEGLDLSVPFTSTLPGDSGEYVSPQLAATVNGTPLTLEGRTRPFEDSLRSEFHFNLDGLDLPQYWSYVPLPREVDLGSGQLSCDLALIFQQTGDGMMPNISVMGTAQVDDLDLTLSRAPLLAFERLSVDILGLSLSSDLLRLGTVRLEGPRASVELDESGALNWLALVPASGKAPAPAKESDAPVDEADDEAAANSEETTEEAAAEPPAKDSGGGFTVMVERVELADGQVDFADKARAFAAQVRPLNIAVDALSTAGGDAAFTLDAGLDGQPLLGVEGRFDPSALTASGALTLTGLDATRAAPYYAEALPVELFSCTVGASTDFTYVPGEEPVITLSRTGLTLADLGLRRKDGKGADLHLGELAASGGEIDVTAQTVDLEAVALRSLALSAARGEAKARTFGTLESIDLAGIRVTAEPLVAHLDKLALTRLAVAAPGDADPALALNRLEIAPVDYDADEASLDIRAILLDGPRLAAALDADGHSNIARIMAAASGEPLPEPAEPEATAEELAEQAEDAAETGAPAPGSPEAVAAGDREGAARPAGTAVTQMQTKFSLGSLTIRKGEVSFRDENISPAYSTALKDLAGRLENVSTRPGAPQAALTLSGTVDGHAPLIVEGSASPTDIGMNPRVKLTLSNLGLTGFSPYTAKYLSNTLATGQLSVDIKTVIEGRDIASDNVFSISNISLGTYAKSPDDIGVPLSLALALLTDRSGNVRLDVPVRGNLDDPQFRLGSVIVKAVLNILFKAVTSPFALLGSLVPGGEDLSALGMTPGTANFGTDAKDKLDSLAEALAKRPRLKLQVAGTSSPAVDSAAMTELRFLRAVKTPKFLDLQERGEAPADLDAVELGEDYAEYLEQAYAAAEFEKETNAFGLTAEQPVEVMEEQLRQHLAATDEDVQELARQRAVHAKDALLERGVDPARVFLREPTDKDAGQMPTGVVMSLQ